MLFKKDWKTWEEIVKEWNDLTNELFRYMDKAAVSKILRLSAKIEKLAKKHSKKLYHEHYTMLISLLEQLSQYGVIMIREFTREDLMWNFQNLVAQIHSLLNDIVYWLRYKQLAPKQFQTAMATPQYYYPQHTPYTAMPYYSMGYTMSPMSPYYYAPGYYVPYHQRGGDLSGLLALLLLYRLLSTPMYTRTYPTPTYRTAARPPAIDPNIFYNAVSDLKATIEQNADFVKKQVGPDGFNRIKQQVDQLFNLALQGKQTGKLPPEVLQQASTIVNRLMTDAKPLTRAALPYIIASIKSLGGAIDGILQRIRAKGIIDPQDYYHLQSLYGQMVSLLRGLPQDIVKDIDPNLLSNSQRWITQYGNLLKQIQGNIGKPIPPSIVNNFQRIVSEINTNSARYISQLPAQFQNILNKSTLSSFRTGQFINPLAPMFQKQISAPTRLPQLPKVHFPTMPRGVGQPPKVSIPQVRIPQIRPPTLPTRAPKIVRPPTVRPIAMPKVKLPTTGKAAQGLFSGLSSLSRMNVRVDSAISDVSKVIASLLGGKK